MERIGIERAPLMWRSRYSCHVLTSMMSAFSPRSSRAFSSSTPVGPGGGGGGGGGGARGKGGGGARMFVSDRRPSAPDDARATARGRPAVTELLRLHGLALAAVGNRIEQEVRA